MSGARVSEKCEGASGESVCVCEAKSYDNYKS